MQRLSPAVLFVFIAMLASAVVGEDLHAATNTSEVHHSGSSSCPDPDSDEDPCDPGCPCACCPGHVTAVASTPGRHTLDAFLSGMVQAFVPDGLHPKDVRSRIFHPPRV